MADKPGGKPRGFEVRVYLVLRNLDALISDKITDAIIASKLSRREATKIAEKNPGSVVHRTIASK